MSTSDDEGAGYGERRSAKAGRPGAMTVAMSAVNLPLHGPKALRIGVIQGGKIVEERLIRQRETVTVGSSEHNHFVIPAVGLPASFELFQIVGSDYILNFTDGMSGRVGLPAGVQTLEQLRSSGAARNAGSHYQVKLPESARGKVTIGEITLLFQFVVPPPVQPRPQLPASVRDGFVKSIDWMFTAFVVFSFTTHFALVVYLENADWPVETGVGVIPDQFVELVLIEEDKPKPAVQPTVRGTTQTKQEKKGDPNATNTGKQTQTPKPSGNKEPAGKGGGGGGSGQGSGGGSAAAIAAEAASAAEAMLLGALSGKGGGALGDVLAGGAVTGNAEDVMAQAGGIGVATGSGGGTLRTRTGGGGGSGKTGGLGTLSGGKGSGSGMGEGEVGEKSVKGSATWAEGDIIGGTGDFDASKVIEMFRSRIRAIQLCYEQQLRRNPTLAGKVVVQFTIEQSGTISKASAPQNTTGDPAVAACVVETVKRFRFNPGPTDGSVTFSYPFVFAPQG